MTDGPTPGFQPSQITQDNSATSQGPTPGFVPSGTLQGAQSNPLQVGVPYSPGKDDFGPGALDRIIDAVRPFASQGVGALAAGGASLIPGVGESGIAQTTADTQGYALTDALMQQLKSNHPGFGESMMEGEKQAVINAVAGQIVKGIFRGGQAVMSTVKPAIYDHFPTTSQALESYGYHALGSAAKFVEDFGAGDAKAKALDRAGGAGFTQALKLANLVNGRMASVNADPVKLADKIRGTLEDGLEKTNDYTSFPVKPKLELPEHPGYPEMPALPEKPGPTPLPDKPATYKSYGQGFKDQIENAHQENVNAIKLTDKQALADYNARVAKIKTDYAAGNDLIDSQHETNVQNAKQDYSQKLDQYKADLQQYKNTPYTVTQEALNVLSGGSNPFSKVDAVLQDSDRLSKVLSAGQQMGKAGDNVRKDLQSYQLMRMVNDATKKDAFGNIRINPDKITAVWNDPDMQNTLNTLWGKQGRENVTNFIQRLSQTQDVQKTYPFAKSIRLVSGGLQLGADVIAGTLSAGKAAKSVGSLFIPLGAMGKLLSNDKVARVVTAMAGAEPLDIPKERAAQMIANALHGTSLAVLDSGGKKNWGHFDAKGEWVDDK